MGEVPPYDAPRSSEPPVPEPPIPEPPIPGPPSPEPPSSLHLTAGEVGELILPSLASAGYVWESSVDGPQGTVDLEWERRAPLATDGIGAGGTERLRVTGRSPGTVRLRVAQRRPWEAERPARATYECEVEVTGPDRG